MGESDAAYAKRMKAEKQARKTEKQARKAERKAKRAARAAAGNPRTQQQPNSSSSGSGAHTILMVGAGGESGVNR